MMHPRPFQARDLDALYAIALATGHAGGDASHLYGDPRMMGHIYAAPYALLEPALALVLEDQEGVAGFVVGTLDTPAWEERLERAWWPALRQRYADPAAADAPSWTPDQRRAFMIHHPSRTPPAVAGPYPAHLHLNLLPRAQRRGAGSALFRAWVGIAAGHGGTTMHVAVNRTNAGALRFWQKQGFEALPPDGMPQGRTVWMVRG